MTATQTPQHRVPRRWLGRVGFARRARPMTPSRLTRHILLTGLVALLASCATTSVTPVGTASYPPLPAASPVLVFSSADEVKKPFETLGIIDHNDPGKYQILTLGDSIPALQDKARAIGANAIIVDEVRPVKSGLISTGIHVRARAIRSLAGDQ
jgi:hypothetical protein